MKHLRSTSCRLHGWKGVFCSRSVFQFTVDKSDTELLNISAQWVKVWFQNPDVPVSRTGRGERPESFSQLWLLSSLRNSSGKANLEGIHILEQRHSIKLFIYYTLYQRSPQIFKWKHTREELLGGRAQLNLLVDLVGEVRLLSSLPAGA